MGCRASVEQGGRRGTKPQVLSAVPDPSAGGLGHPRLTVAAPFEDDWAGGGPPALASPRPTGNLDAPSNRSQAGSAVRESQYSVSDRETASDTATGEHIYASTGSRRAASPSPAPAAGPFMLTPQPPPQPPAHSPEGPSHARGRWGGEPAAAPGAAAFTDGVKGPAPGFGAIGDGQWGPLKDGGGWRGLTLGPALLPDVGESGCGTMSGSGCHTAGTQPTGSVPSTASSTDYHAKAGHSSRGLAHGHASEGSDGSSSAENDPADAIRHWHGETGQKKRDVSRLLREAFLDGLADAGGPGSQDAAVLPGGRQQAPRNRRQIYEWFKQTPDPQTDANWVWTGLADGTWTPKEREALLHAEKTHEALRQMFSEELLLRHCIVDTSDDSGKAVYLFIDANWSLTRKRFFAGHFMRMLSGRGVQQGVQVFIIDNQEVQRHGRTHDDHSMHSRHTASTASQVSVDSDRA
eukprot:TRINITY_DN12841_c0_g1_i1.p1 TRINITY_DN12841_c0_g1~~TRINITY_DN12841_c0_g1_i1.p1  ORF type:complete len:463 (+),score=86.43 TRINITY_DN12841_c0_g1_i1:163-1551(+)